MPPRTAGDYGFQPRVHGLCKDGRGRGGDILPANHKVCQGFEEWHLKAGRPCYCTECDHPKTWGEFNRKRGKVKFRIRQAELDEHDRIVKIGATSPYTKGVSNPMFLDEKSYEKGWVAVAEARIPESSKSTLLGFVVVRNLVRKPYTSLYYVGVHPAARSKGIGEKLVQWAYEQSPHDRVRLIVEQENERAHSFYENMGFRYIGEGSNKAGEPYRIYVLDDGTWQEE